MDQSNIWTTEYEKRVFAEAKKIMPNLDLEYPLFWGHPTDSGGMLLATPFWESEGVPLQVNTADGYPLPDVEEVPFVLTGDPVKDAETYSEIVFTKLQKVNDLWKTLSRRG